MKVVQKRKAYIVGGGIASLASAAYLIKDGKFNGKDIILFETDKKLGGALDSTRLSKKSYVMRGYRMFEKRIYSATLDLMSFIPSLKNSKKNLKQELLEFNKIVKVRDKCRLIGSKTCIEAKHLGLNWRDRFDITRIFLRSEFSLSNSTISDNFSQHFFETNYWFELATTFAFQKWHSAVEFKRYLHRFLHDSMTTDTLTGLKSTPYNQYDSMILPIQKWLKKKGVVFKTNSTVINLDFNKSKGKNTVKGILYLDKGKKKKIDVNTEDYVFATVGSMVEDSRIGSMTSKPSSKQKKMMSSWVFWENIAKNKPELGKPANFDKRINKSNFSAFTISTKNSILPKLIERSIGNKAGHGGIVTFKDSNWLLSFIIPKQPYAIDQPKGLTVFWGYGLLTDKKGNYVKKKMTDCTGKEILTEFCNHMGLEKDLSKIIKTTKCIPIILPYTTSHFMPRKKGDRPQVIPSNTTNLALLGQFVEMPKEINFTIEYSVRSAQLAVYSLLGIEKKPSPMYQGQHHLKVLLDVSKAMFR